MDKSKEQTTSNGTSAGQNGTTTSWDVGLQKSILRGGMWVVRHWLAIVCLALAIFIALPLSAPLLMAGGQTGPAQAIYRVYRLTCHQDPARSYFVGGPRLVYSRAELEAITPVRPLPDYLGSPSMGYKIAFCERDLAIYLSVLIFLMFYGAIRRKLPRLPMRLYLLLILPMAVDGFSQLTGARESTWLLRTVTGVLFGVATAWLLAPEVDKAMETTVRQFDADVKKLPPG